MLVGTSGCIVRVMELVIECSGIERVLILPLEVDASLADFLTPFILLSTSGMVMRGAGAPVDFFAVALDLTMIKYRDCVNTSYGTYEERLCVNTGAMELMKSGSA